jgi:hypothetical protein
MNGVVADHRMAFVPGHQWRRHRYRADRVFARRGSMRTAVDRVYGTACPVCGWDKAVLDIAHIRPGTKLTDVVPFCPNCHRLFDLELLDPLPILEFQAARLAEVTETTLFDLDVVRRLVR